MLYKLKYYCYNEEKIEILWGNNNNMGKVEKLNELFEKWKKEQEEEVDVNDKENQLLSSSLHGKYVAGAVYKVVQERGKDASGYDESTEKNQPKVGEYEIIIDNYSATSKVKVPIDQSEKTLNILYRYYLPTSDANSNYDPEKVFDGTYPKIDDIPGCWFILPEQYKASVIY